MRFASICLFTAVFMGGILYAAMRIMKLLS